MIEVPRELCWDYPSPPRDDAWRLQRIAEFFPHFGRDRRTVEALYEARKKLRVPPEVVELIEIYARLHQIG